MEYKIALEMKNICKTFPGVRALRNVNFSVREGEVMSLMGENGAGKSTLVKIITGVYTMDSGEMIFRGASVKPRDTLEARQVGISTVFQELNLSPFLSVAENIYLGKAPKKYGLINWSKMYADAAEIMNELKIPVDVHARLETQSTAIQQMVSIARSYTENAKLLIMDEATSSLTGKEVDVLFDLVWKLKSRGIAIVFITHKLDEIYKISDRITVLKDGELVSADTIENMPKLKMVSNMIGRDASAIIGKKKTYDPQTQEGEILCSVRSIEKANHRLNKIDLDIRKGEVVGVAGLLGAGKTELAKVLFGADVHYEGEIIYNQQAVRFRDPSEAIKMGESFCPEDRKVEGIFPVMSIQDNLTMTVMGRVSKHGIINKKRLRQITEEYIQKIRIKTPSTATQIKNLSGGNQQKVVLSRWLTVEPDLIILDEPTRGIDVGAKDEIEAIVQNIAQRGISVLYISSELDELVRQCDRIVVLREGRKTKEFVGDDISVDAITAAMTI